METNWDRLGDNELIVKLKSDYIQLHANGLLDYDQLKRILARGRAVIRDSNKKCILIIAFTEDVILHHDVDAFMELIDDFPCLHSSRCSWVEMNPDAYADLVQLENQLIEKGCNFRLFYEEQHATRWLINGE